MNAKHYNTYGKAWMFKHPPPLGYKMKLKSVKSIYSEKKGGWTKWHPPPVTKFKIKVA